MQKTRIGLGKKQESEVWKWEAGVAWGGKRVGPRLRKSKTWENRNVPGALKLFVVGSVM